ncbi:protein trafficking Pga2 [Triangularia verruculosa]|uniref:Protein trafficking Pga2 n=1 Tax=Triangularia verruculosa TaxID=2587418 RepID=A0AAN7AY41_9PEZI|nr:protein trafficking Pga2 [Triangularia verruculosa]
MEDIAHLATTLGDRFTTNLKSTLDNMSPQKWIRVIIVAGAYLLLRPYLMKLGGRAQMASYEEEHATTEAEHAAKAKISPNELRGKVRIPDDTDSEGDEEEGASTATDWGKKARRRQRDMIKKLLEAEEKRLQESKEEEEDKDIEEFLIKD